MRRECRERFPRHRLERKPLVSDPGMHHGTCITHVPWCIPGLLTRGGGENVPGIPGACATRNFTYLARGPWRHLSNFVKPPSVALSRFHGKCPHRVKGYYTPATNKLFNGSQVYAAIGWCDPGISWMHGISFSSAIKLEPISQWLSCRDMWKIGT